MNWLKTKLRKWLIGDMDNAVMLDCFDELQERVFKDVSAIRLRVDKMPETLKQLSDESLRLIRHARENALVEIKGEIGQMEYIFPGRKRVAVKTVVTGLLSRLGFYVAVQKYPNGELHPVIKSKPRLKKLLDKSEK